MRKLSLLVPYVLCFCIHFCVSFSVAQTTDVSLVVDGIQKKYGAVNDFHSTFTQETTVRNPAKEIISSGKVWFKRPAMMRWEYETPWKDIVVSDGSTVRYLDSRENQITETSLEDTRTNQFDHYAFVSVLRDLDRLFDISRGSAGPDKNGNTLLVLKPKQTLDQSKEVTIAVDPETFSVEKIIITDIFGTTTVISLGPAQINKNLSDSLFVLAEPQGAKTVTFP